MAQPVRVGDGRGAAADGVGLERGDPPSGGGLPAEVAGGVVGVRGEHDVAGGAVRDVDADRLTSRRYWDEIKRDLKPIYIAVNATAARATFDDLAEKWVIATRP